MMKGKVRQIEEMIVRHPELVNIGPQRGLKENGGMNQNLLNQGTM